MKAARAELLAPDAGEARAQSGLRWLVFAVTWVSYAAYYLTRQPVSSAKARLSAEFGYDNVDLNWIDEGYLVAYAAGQFLWGWVGDKVGPRRMLACGMLATAAASALFGMSRGLGLFALLWTLNGLFQATGWSSNVKAMTLWMNPRRRGALMGVWSTCYQIGPLVALPIAAAFLVAYGWRGAFIGPAVIVATAGALVFLLLPDVRTPTGVAERAEHSQVRREARAEVVRNPLIWALGSSYFFMKLTRYALLFWLPKYMHDALRYGDAKASNTAMAFVAGGALGSITIGWLSERFFSGRRLSVGILSLLALAVALLLYGEWAGVSTAANILLLAAIGFFLFGPDTLLSATAAQDIGGPRAAATAAGFINGLGSVGPIFGGFVISKVSMDHGWTLVYTLLGAGSVISALVLVPFWWKHRAR